MKERYVSKNYERISLDEIFAAIGLTEIKPDLGVWVQGALADNPKVQYYPEEKYLFKPALGHDVSNRKQLMAKLRDNELKGFGGTTVSDIKEAVYNHEKALKVCIHSSLHTQKNLFYAETERGGKNNLYHQAR